MDRCGITKFVRNSPAWRQRKERTRDSKTAPLRSEEISLLWRDSDLTHGRWAARSLSNVSSCERLPTKQRTNGQS